MQDKILSLCRFTASVVYRMSVDKWVHLDIILG